MMNTEVTAQVEELHNVDQFKLRLAEILYKDEPPWDRLPMNFLSEGAEVMVSRETSTEPPKLTLNAEALRDDKPLHYVPRNGNGLFRFYSSATYRRELAKALYPRMRNQSRRLERFDQHNSLNDYLEDVVTAIRTTAATIKPGQWALYNLRYTERKTEKEFEFLVEVSESGVVEVDLYLS